MLKNYTLYVYIANMQYLEFINLEAMLGKTKSTTVLSNTFESSN